MIHHLHRSFFISFILLSTNISLAQFSLKANLEGGYYSSAGSEQENLDNFISRFEAQLGYEYKDESKSATIQLKVRPEYYGFEKTFKTLKIHAVGNYFQSGNVFSWGINASKQNNFYTGNNINLNYDIFSLSLQASYLINNNYLLSSSFGFAYQNVSKDFNQKLDLIFGDFRITQPLFPNFKIGYGIYAERFYLENEMLNLNSINITKQNNKGWRLGPQLSLGYLKFVLINFNYRFLFHKSTFTKQPSYEHWIRFVTGKIISSDWSAFILVDYYLRKFTLKGSYTEKFIPLYNPINLENRIFLKVAYEVNENVETYFKTGYSKENLYNNFSFSGLNFLFGVEITN